MTQAQGRLLIVANRLPVTVDNGPEGPTLEPSAGGLASALRDVHAVGETLWLGWPGELPRGRKARQIITERLSDLGAIPVQLTREEVARYYDGFSNGVLWPLFHYLLDKVRLDAKREWDTYRGVNRRFADEVVRNHRPGDLIWVHDYQLALVPAMVREQLPEARIGFFLHIPFPAAEVFRILPWRAEILRGMLGADLVGFHVADYSENFAAATAQVLGAVAVGAELQLGPRRVRVGVHPVGVDTARFTAATSHPDVVARAEAIRADAGGRAIVLAVDRLDYTKGIPRRLLAINRLLEESPELRDRVRFVQIAVPSRERVAAYAELQRDVNELVGRINARHGTTSSVPVHLLYRALPFEELVALYRAADVMLVTPLRDGMNLVAKEYVASRDAADGVLVLSEFAGAAAALTGALAVNPYDLESMRVTIGRALQMPREEQRERMEMMRGAVAASTARDWAEGFVGGLAGPSAGGSRSPAVTTMAELATVVGRSELAGALSSARE
ncbi:MAG: bifunctional alpha,alpha-trehalose-phosphate synthase (UDP-forming)/trehalose-phosphatase [Deltaproteobacteria bacterium]|nr:bifunctional alpha,alpha-trehalose-phosphate synthase (UDP-forming)/trehalose-phosphatase [Deltaproteobacteria bacterium]